MKFLMRVQGDKRYAKRIRRLLWRRRAENKISEFSIDAYAGVIDIYGNSNDEAVVKDVIKQAKLPIKTMEAKSERKRSRNHSRGRFKARLAF